VRRLLAVAAIALAAACGRGAARPVPVEIDWPDAGVAQGDGGTAASAGRQTSPGPAAMRTQRSPSGHYSLLPPGQGNSQECSSGPLLPAIP